MDASRKIEIKKQELGIKGDYGGPVQLDKRGRVKDPNVLYWFRTPDGQMKPVYRDRANFSSPQKQTLVTSFRR